MKSLFKGLALALLLAGTATAASAQDKQVTIVLPDPLPTVDSCQVQTSSQGRVIKLNVFEALTEIDLEHGGAKPRLATEWEQLTPETWRFKFREGVTFHDGQPLNAEAVVFSIERALDPALSCDALQRYFGQIAVTTSIVDEHTVDITTDPVQPILPTLLEAISIISPATPRNELTRQPIGTGPYRFTSWDPQNDIILDRYDGYWGAQPEVERARYLWRQESVVRAAMVELGEADIALIIADQDANNPETDHVFYNAEMTRIQINTDQPPFDDVRVRKALNLALDRQGLIGVLLNAGVKPAAQIIGPSTLGYDPSIVSYPYDPDEARRLIEEARADGAPVDREIQMFARANNFPNDTEVMEAFVAMWAEVGLKVSVQSLELAQYQASGRPPFEPNRPPTLRFSSHDNTTGDGSVSIFSKYHSSSHQTDVPSAEADALIEKAVASVGEDRRQQFQAILRTIHADIVPEIWAYEMVSTIRVHQRIKYTPNAASNAQVELAQITFN